MNKKIFFFTTILFLYLNLTSVCQIKENLFGFCTTNSFTYVDTEDSSFIFKIKKISPKVLRFPGGTIGNFYHIHKEAYGLKISDVEEWYSGRFSTRVRSLKEASAKRGHNNNYIEDFILLAKKLNASVVINANILTAEDKEIIDIISRFKSEKINIVGIELGSELSNRAYKKKIDSVKDYITLAKSCAKKIKLKFPNIQVAVVAAPLKNKMPYRLKNWNTNLAKEDFYDAIIHHSYYKVVDGLEDAGVMILEDEVNYSQKEKFNIYKDRLILELDSGFTERIKMYNDIFGNKDIWITEWNLQMTKTTANSMLQSLFVSNYVLEILSNKELKSIKIATYHNLAGRDVSGSIFQSDKRDLIIHSTYYPFIMLSVLFQKDIVKIKRNNLLDKETYIYDCYSSSNKLEISYIINWSSNNFDYLTKNNMSVFNSFYSEELYDRANKQGQLSSAYYLLEKESNLLIKPYSVSIIEYKDE